MGSAPKGWAARANAKATGTGTGSGADACPKCGAVGDEPCRTQAGKKAKNRHNERT